MTIQSDVKAFLFAARFYVLKRFFIFTTTFLF